MATASCTGNTSVASGWQLYQMTSTDLANISGLSYNSSTSTFTFPSGVFVIQGYLYNNGSTIWGLGTQSSVSASLPASTTNPSVLDWYINSLTNDLLTSMNFSFTYVFTSSNPVRFYIYSSSATTLLSTNKISILQL